MFCELTDSELVIEKIHDYIKDPSYATDGSVGIDIYCPKTVVFLPGRTTIVPLGIKCKFPKTLWGKLEAKSGLAVKNGLDFYAGVIDSDYRHEICAVLISHGEQPFTIEKGQKIIQMVMMPVIKPRLTIGQIDDPTTRFGGFGSTGK
jgi:dUTP pyrophosphatase